jgi:hypothetical protein
MAAVLSAAILPATAQEMEWLSGTGDTAFSGNSNGTRELSHDAHATLSVSGIEARERSDDPCFLEVEFRDINSFQAGESLTFRRCGAGHRDGNLPTTKRLVMPEGAYTTGARVCLNNAGDKLKGLALIGQYQSCAIGGDSVIIPPSACSGVFPQNSVEYRLCNTAETGNWRSYSCSDPRVRIEVYFERTNCQGGKNGPDSDWEREVHCPFGQVATGMHLSTRDGSGTGRMIDGVALECRSMGVFTGSKAVRPD